MSNNPGIIVIPAPSYLHIAGVNAGTTVKSGAGTLLSISVNASSGTTIISVYNAISATNPIAIIATAAGTTPNNINYNLNFTTGLFIVTAGAATDITVMYQ